MDAATRMELLPSQPVAVHGAPSGSPLSYPEVVDGYLGTPGTPYEGEGNRKAFLIALGNAANTDTHSVIGGRAPAGATLRLTKTFETPTWEGTVRDTLRSTLRVGSTGRYLLPGSVRVPQGSRRLTDRVASSAGFVGEKERALIQDPQPARCIRRW